MYCISKLQKVILKLSGNFLLKIQLYTFILVVNKSNGYSSWNSVYGFYKRLVGVTGITLKRSIGRLQLTCIRLQTILAKIEATLNSRPLTYSNDVINYQVMITPVHLLSINVKHGLPQIGEKYGPDYKNQPLDFTQQLLKIRKKGN